MATDPTNNQIADLLEQIASLFDEQGDNPFYVRACREGAQTIQDTKLLTAELIRLDHLDELKPYRILDRALLEAARRPAQDAAFDQFMNRAHIALA